NGAPALLSFVDLLFVDPDVMKNAPTAAALVIGNEILSGKIRDANVPHLARELFSLGITLRRVIVCPDEVETIVDDLDALRRHHHWVFTSGGVGPTHDDVTIRSVARAFAVPIVRAPELEALLRDHFGSRLTDHHLRMAEVPEGAEMVAGSGARWPVMRMDNVFVLPGVPQIFRRKLAVIREYLDSGVSFVSRTVHTTSEEGDIASLLHDVVDAFPEVAVGSYPRWDDNGRYTLTITFDGRFPERVEQAVAKVRAALPADRLIEPPDTAATAEDE
ncbi:MAG: molybdopterin-binding protein, partial [Acidobacteriota bacterium]